MSDVCTLNVLSALSALIFLLMTVYGAWPLTSWWEVVLAVLVGGLVGSLLGVAFRAPLQGRVFGQYRPLVTLVSLLLWKAAGLWPWAFLPAVILLAEIILALLVSSWGRVPGGAAR